MTDPRSVVRGLIVYGLCLPVAIVLGYMLANPLSYESLFIVGLILTILLFPIMLRWHQPMLLLFWNTSAVIFFVRGHPPVRYALIGVSLLIIWLMYALDRRSRPQNVSSVTWPLVFLTGVVLMTAMLTGGIGFRVFGSQAAGGTRYLAMLAAVMGYFALSARPIPLAKANLYTALFFLGGLSLAMGSLMTVLPSYLQFVFLVFPVERFHGQESVVLGVTRLTGVSMAAMAAIFYLLARHGIRGIFAPRKLGRAILFIGLCGICMLGGYRSYMLLIFGIIVVQLYLERLLTLRLLPGLLLVCFLGLALLPLAHRLPYQMQRSLAFIPSIVSPEAARDARNSSEWRLVMWKRVLADVPKYFWLGKGYALDYRNMELSLYRGRMGGGEMAESAELAGDYHNGPLTTLVTFGVWGAIGLVWFWIAGWRVLLRNYRYGPEELKVINTFLLAFFVTRVVHFLVIFGSIQADMMQFAGLIGLSVALNGGVAQRQLAPATILEPAPERRRVWPRPLSPPAPSQG